ncbi:hypothetical protein CKQ53_13210 [Lonsdalea britannica]|uniref:Uncharacterized protein n=1 Tax=Lonsdalea britannica TaxID=1082704 RepID=A0AAD0SMF4_9GAMM|nr:hypothetical protein [Lonsdalea britannica]AXW87833.1 hypothetical protein CKQ53_13210 [Lonsdalea britannica]
MSENKELLIDSLAAQTVLHFVISVLTNEQKELLKGLANCASPAIADPDEDDEIREYMKEMHIKVKEIIEIGTKAFE